MFFQTKPLSWHIKLYFWAETILTSADLSKRPQFRKNKNSSWNLKIWPGIVRLGIFSGKYGITLKGQKEDHRHTSYGLVGNNNGEVKGVRFPEIMGRGTGASKELWVDPELNTERVAMVAIACGGGKGVLDDLELSHLFGLS